MRRLLNFWRLRTHTEEGVNVEFYTNRNGETWITRVRELPGWETD